MKRFDLFSSSFFSVNFVSFASYGKKISLFCFNLHTHYFICLLIKSARVMSFTIFDNVVVVAIAARKLLHVFLVLPCYQSSYIFLCLSYFLKRWKVWLIDWDKLNKIMLILWGIAPLGNRENRGGHIACHLGFYLNFFC